MRYVVDGTHEKRLVGSFVAEIMNRRATAARRDAILRRHTGFGVHLEIVRTLGRLKPRLYTLASSPRLHPGEAHFTVAVAPRGLASTWLAQKLPVGAAARMFVNRGRLRLPARGDAPAIMIGASTGIALYRAFLQERKATGASS